LKPYPITSPDHLRDLTKMIKWDKDKKAVWDFADDWYTSGEQRSVALEIGNSAQIIYTTGKKRIVLATLYQKAAKDYVKNTNSGGTT